ncbi:MAG: hypothetical protein K2J75_02065, partial [Clostridia bacterium]|nr:hypothetical protein [Clostridia bacterium]
VEPWDKNNATLYARWEAKTYKIILDSNMGIQYPRGSVEVTFDKAYVIADPILAPEYWSEGKTHYTRTYKFEGWYTDASGGGKKIESTGIYDDINVTTLYAQWSSTVTYTTDKCVAPGSLITLADGSQKPVEKLTGDEMLLVWNIYTGDFDVAPILFIDSDEQANCEIINLYFSDDTRVKVISEHGFWDYNLNEWIFLRNDAAKYIGHWFNKQSIDGCGNFVNEKVQLIDVEITEEVTTAWSPVTFGHLCYYVNGLLSMPGATEGFINIFDVDPETLKVDELKMAADIEKYGLFTYDDFAEYIPEEVFYAFNGQYLKVAMGKEMLTWDDILALINRYQSFWQAEEER